MNTEGGNLFFGAGIDISQLRRDADRLKAELKGIGQAGDVEGAKLQNSFNGIGKGLAALGGTAAIALLGKQILDVTGKFEKFGIVLKNTLGDLKGAESLEMISKFAATTPFQLDEVTGAFIKMANQGFVPTQSEMIKLGDLASSTGKSFDQLGEALLDAQTGQFERLKEFGIKASANGENVTFSFKEQKTVVENTNSAIQRYILSLGELKGVAGANALISASLTGQISNLSDKLAAMYNRIGSDNKGVLYAAVGGASALVENYETVGKVLLSLVAVYGAYKAAVLIQNAVLAENAAINAMVASSNGVLSKSLAYQWLWTERQTVAQTGLNRAMALSPYVAATAAVLALGYGIYKLITYTTDAEKAQKKLNEAVIESNKDIEAERLEIDALFARLTAAKTGTEEYGAAKKALFDKYGEQLRFLGDERTALNDIALAYDTITESAQKSARARGLSKVTTETSNATAEVTGKSRKSINELLQEKFKGQTDANGVGLAATYFAKIVPVIEGKGEITKEIQDILNLFNSTKTVGASRWAPGIQMPVNPLIDELDKIRRAKSIFDKTMAEANVRFGEVPAQGKEKPFDATLLSLQELMAELPKATEQMNTLKKAESLDPAKLTSQGEKVNSIKAEISAREKQLAIINEVEAQVKLLADEQKKYAVNDVEYKNLESRIDALKAKLPGTSKKEIDQIKAVSEAMKIAVEQDLDLLAEKLVALEKINAAQEQAIADAKGRVYGKARNAENERLLRQIDNPSAEMIPLVKPVSSSAASGVKAVGLEVDKLAKGVKATNEETKKLSKEVDSSKQAIISEYFYSAANAASTLASVLGDGNEQIAKMLGGIAEMANGIGDFVNLSKSEGGLLPMDAVSLGMTLFSTLVGVFDSFEGSGDKHIARLKAINLELEKQNQLVEDAKRLGSVDVASKSLIDTLRVKLKELQDYYRGIFNLTTKVDLTDQQLSDKVQAIADLEKQIKEAEQSLTDFLAGGITENALADSIAQAFQDGKGSVEDFGEYTNKILREAVLTAFKANILGDTLTNAQKQISEAFKDKTLTADEIAGIKTTMANATQEAKASWDKLTSAFPDMFASDATRSASSKGFASMSQDTGNELNGRFTAIQGHTFGIAEGVKILQANSAQVLKHLAGIENNTARLQAIEQGINDINLKGITLKK